MKPEFFRHELLQDLEVTHPGKCPMLVFAGLWGHCDKAGRFEWKPRMLKLDILPFLPFDMEETMTILAQAGLLKRYESNGKGYGYVPSFADHQRINGKESQEPEKYPQPPDYDEETAREAPGKQPGSIREAVETTGREGKGREYVGQKSPDVPRLLRQQSLEVLIFLNEKAGKKFEPVEANLELISARLKDGASIEDCKAIVERKCAAWSADEKMAQYLRPATLFNRTKFAQYQGENGSPRVTVDL